jgi:hypothetical protein
VESDEIDRTAPADLGTCCPEVTVAASSQPGNCDVATMPEAWPQILLAGLLAWAFPPLALIGMVIIHRA